MLNALADHGCLDAVIDALGDVHDRTDQLALLFVSRAVSEAAIRVVYSAIIVRERTLVERLLETLNQRPERCGMIGWLGWIGYSDKRGPGDRVDLQQAASIMSLAHNVRHLEVWPSTEPLHRNFATLRPILVANERLGSLTLGSRPLLRGSIADQHTLESLLGHPVSDRLRALTLGWAFPHSDRWPIMPRVVHFEEPGYSLHAVSSAVLEQALPALTSLSVRHGWDRLRTASDGWAAQIRHLRLGDSDRRDYQRAYRDLPQLLGRFTHLESLELDGILPIPQLVAAIPSSVVELRVTRCVPTPAEIPLLPGTFVKVATQSTLPALRHLRIVNWLRTDALDQACEARGISIDEVPDMAVRHRTFVSADAAQ